MDFGVRNATTDDAEAIAALHACTWQAAYRSLAPAAAIATLTTEVRLARWRLLLQAPGPDQVTLVADGGGMLTGFGQLGPSSNEQFGGRREIKFLYVAEGSQGRGIGRRLMAALALSAIDQGAAGVALAVVNGNDGAIEFYRRLGGRHIGRFTDPGPVWRSDNLIYAWDDLHGLTSRHHLINVAYADE